MWSDNPERDFIEYDAEQDEWLQRRPLCECCNEPIQEDKAIYYNDQWFCEACEEEAWEVIREDLYEPIEVD